MLLTIFLIGILLTLFLCFLALPYAFLIPPRDFPKNIPTIPFYVSLLSLFTDVDQADLYGKYLAGPLQQYGAVKIFFGARWNILVTRPAFVAEVFKCEDSLYPKSGNQKKIPYSVLAEYTGDNIISAHGENWRLYQSVLKPGLQREFEVEPILKNAHTLIRLLFEEQKLSGNGSVLLPQLLQRYTLANLSESLLGADFQTLQNPNAPLHTLQLAVKREIFKPFFLNFPFLDLLPVKSRDRARKLVVKFADELCATVLRGHRHQHDDPSTDRLGCRMIAGQFRDNMVSVFLAGHENPQLLLTSMIFLLGENQDAQARLRQEIMSVGPSDQLDYTALQNVPYQTSVIYETLRLFPPISQLLNRKTTQDVMLGGKIPVPAGTYLGYNAYATGRDHGAWGANANDFKPERWGSTVEEINANYRRVNSRASFIAFHGGRRACLGQKFAMFEARLSMATVLREVKWWIDPAWVRKMTLAGPLYPRMLRVRFERLQGTRLDEKQGFDLL
ncbi:hypothetical protein EPUS_07662 [Endocarpon pusillum Z07020]|uniref:Dit2 protein n=1 Tax=Endocarpon pusillum (strain Z07020 / HMAS-L-300199) TaxID=1263415 RepID=U1GYB9_ENDPU|nr:uncharacterized protein EPUS_07662 [Endocarpon pusillum Z07020]ERF77121.1 hypothetical protein EPUS_07662 [Endocarpon pusillum Z07020]